MNCSKSITVYLHDINRPIQSITVSSTDSVRILDDQITTKGQRVLFCNGMILMPAFSFQYLNVQNGDHVFVIRPNETKLKTGQTSQNQKPSKDNKSSLSLIKSLKRNQCIASYQGEALDFLTDSSILHEASRLSDLSKNHLDSNLLAHYYNLQQKAEVESKENPKKKVSQIIFQTPSSPSSEALPFLWGLM